jgi:hypothetical protein
MQKNLNKIAVASILLLALVHSAAVYAAPSSTPPQHTDALIPVPPEQNAPWSATEGSPPALVTAAITLYDQGLPDPRGCDYREVSVYLTRPASEDLQLVKTHAWLLPATSTDQRRFAICWNGLIYPVSSVGDSASPTVDITNDISTDAARQTAASHVYVSQADYVRSADYNLGEPGSVSQDTLLPLKACFLLRLGQGDLAGKYWSEWSSTLAKPLYSGDDPVKHPYSVLAQEWLKSMYDRAISEHASGDDKSALLHFQILTQLQPKAEEASANYRCNVNLEYLSAVPGLLEDEQRRVQEHRDVADEPNVAELIEDLENASDNLSDSGQGGDFRHDPTVEALIAVGSDAVEPLLDTLANDNRLRRSMRLPLATYGPATPTFVYEAAYAALRSIVQNPLYNTVSRDDALVKASHAGRVQAAADIKAFWQKYGRVSTMDRLYEILADDDANPRDWLDAASVISRLEFFGSPPIRDKNGKVIGVMSITGFIKLKPYGESLRSKENPSVTDLMTKRVSGFCKVPLKAAPVIHAHDLTTIRQDLHDLNIAFIQNDSGLQNAVSMALDLASWDPVGAVPALRDAYAQTVKYQQFLDTYKYDSDVPDYYSSLTEARIEGRDPTAITDYETALRGIHLSDLGPYNSDLIFRAIWLNSWSQDMLALSHRLFQDPTSQYYHFGDSYQLNHVVSSPLLSVGEFEQAVQRELSDQTVIATYAVKLPGSAEIDYVNGEVTSIAAGSAVAVGTTQPIRRCYAIANALQDAQGMEAFDYLWSLDRRNAVVALDETHLSQKFSMYGNGPLSKDGWPGDYHACARLQTGKH